MVPDSGIEAFRLVGKFSGRRCERYLMNEAGALLPVLQAAATMPRIMQTGPLHIEESTVKGERVLRLDGPLTLNNIFQFQTIVRADRSSSLIVDLTNVPYVDSAGIGSLVGAHVSRQAGGTLTLVGVSPRVRDALQVTRVEQFLRIADTVEQVVSAAAPSRAAG